MSLDTSNFTQLNLVAVIERANSILGALNQVTDDVQLQRDILATVECTQRNGEPGDDWEHASQALARLEVTERCIREEDPTCESAPKGYAGGFANMINLTTVFRKDNVPIPPFEDMTTQTPPNEAEVAVTKGLDLDKLPQAILDNIIKGIYDSTQIADSVSARTYARGLTAEHLSRLYIKGRYPHLDPEARFDICNAVNHIHKAAST